MQMVFSMGADAGSTKAFHARIWVSKRCTIGTEIDDKLVGVDVTVDPTEIDHSFGN